MFLGTKPRETSRSCDHERKQNGLFLARSVINCFVVPLHLEVEKKAEKNCLLYAGLPQFQGARPYYVWVGSWCCCFPSELMSSVRLRQLVNFDPRYVTRSTPIEKMCWSVEMWENVEQELGIIMTGPFHDLKQYEQFSLFFHVNKTTPA